MQDNLYPNEFQAVPEISPDTVRKIFDFAPYEFGIAEYRSQIGSSHCSAELWNKKAETGEGTPPLFLKGQECSCLFKNRTQTTHRMETPCFQAFHTLFPVGVYDGQYTRKNNEQVSSGVYIGKEQRKIHSGPAVEKRPGAGQRADSLQITAALSPPPDLCTVLFLLKNASAGFLPCGGAFLCGGLYSATNSPSAVSRNCSGAGW